MIICVQCLLKPTIIWSVVVVMEQKPKTLRYIFDNYFKTQMEIERFVQTRYLKFKTYWKLEG